MVFQSGQSGPLGAMTDTQGTRAAKGKREGHEVGYNFFNFTLKIADEKQKKNHVFGVFNGSLEIYTIKKGFLVFLSNLVTLLKGAMAF